MTVQDKIHEFKTIAKRYARAHRIPHHEGLDWIAKEAGQPHWKAFTVAWEKGWRPGSSLPEVLRNQLESVSTGVTPNIETSLEAHGVIDGHPYEVHIGFDAVVHGDGWAISVGEAPSEELKVEVYKDPPEVPISNPEFFKKAVEIVEEAAEVLRNRTASDWPRRSTKPDSQGRVVHPLWANSELSSQWHCLHCDGAFSGRELAENMWHCPSCNATPLDIFAVPFWNGPRE